MKAPAFKFYAQDFLTGCTYLTNEEIGMYIKMLCKQWTDGNIPKKRLGFLVGIEWDNISEELKRKFTDFGDYIINERLENEREKSRNFREKQAENGKKGGRPKKTNTSSSIDNTDTKTQRKPKENPKENQVLSQKKPLEYRILNIEHEKEKEKEGLGEKTKTKSESEKVILPFESENFKVQWQLWRAYKNKEYGFKYKSTISEQASLKKLAEIAENNEKTAIAIINQSIENNWKGFFALKTQNFTNGENRTASGFAKNR